MSNRLALPARRNHITQKVRIAGQRTHYLSVHDDEHPAEVFLRVKGPDCSSELIGLYDVISRLMGLASVSVAGADEAPFLIQIEAAVGGNPQRKCTLDPTRNFAAQNFDGYEKDP